MQRNVANPLIRKPECGYGVPSELILCLLLATIFLLAPVGVLGQQSKPPAIESMITDWSVVGPFANVGGTGVVRRSLPELDSDTATSFENMWGGVARWNPYHAADLFGWVNLTGHSPTKSCLFLARTGINSPREERVHLRLGLIGAARLYLNDSLIAAVDDDVFARSSSMTISCVLAQGWNTLRIRIGRDVMPLLSFSLAIEDTTGRPLPGITISSAMHSKSSVNPAARMQEKRRDEIDTVFQRNPDILNALRIAAAQDTSGAQWLTSQAQEHLKTGNAAAALSSAQRALSLVQELAPAWNVKGLAHYELGNRDSARICLERALEIDPGLKEAWHGSFSLLNRPNPLNEITPVDLDSLARAAVKEAVQDSRTFETIFTDVQQAILFGSTIVKRADLVLRIHATPQDGLVPLPSLLTKFPLTRRHLFVIGGDGSKRTINLDDSVGSLSGMMRGDVIVYRVERIVRDSTFPLFANADMGISNSSPVRRARLSIIVPSTSYYQFDVQNFAPDFSERETPFGTLFTWEARDVPEMVPEPYMPPAETYAPFIAFGTCRGWKSVNSYAEDSYARRLQPCDELRSLVERLLPSQVKWSKEAIVQSISKWVIDSLVLVDDPATVLSPNRACDVLHRRSGSAADKVVLAATMMTERGIEAIPTLVNTSSGFSYRIPSPSLPYDHAVLVLPAERRVHMIDLSARTMPFGIVPRSIEESFAMALSPRMRDPLLIPRGYINPREFYARSVITFEDIGTATHDVAFRASDYDSSAMMSTRDRITNPSDADVERKCDTAWITAATNSPLTPTLHMRGTLKSYFQVSPSKDTCSFLPMWTTTSMYQDTPYDLERRAFPLVFEAAHDSTTEEILIVPPKGYRFAKPLPTVNYSLPSMRYSHTSVMSGKNLLLRRTVVLHKSRVEPADYPAFREAHRSMIKIDTTPVVLIRTGKPRRK